MEVHKWKKKKEKAERDGDLNLMINACKSLADIYMTEERYDEALEEYKTMERVSEANGCKMGIARANRMIGEVYSEKGEFKKAINHQLKHLKIARDEGDKVEEQRALATLGRTFFLQAECLVGNDQERGSSLSDAKKFYSRSLTLCDQLSEDRVGTKQLMEMRSRLYLNLGLVFDCQNQFDSAVEFMQKAVNICKKVEFWEDLFRTYSALGGIYHKRGMKTEALSTYDKALVVAERLSSKAQHMCEVLPLKAEVLLENADFRGARQALVKAYKLRSPSAPVRAEIERKLRTVAAMCETEDKFTELPSDGAYDARKTLYENMGDMAADLNVFSLALTYYHLMLQCVEKVGGDQKSLVECYVSLAQTYKDDKQYGKAAEYFKKELILERDNPKEACKTSVNIAECFQLLNDQSSRLLYLEKAKVYSNESFDPKLKRYVLGFLKKSLEESGSDAGGIDDELNNLDDYSSDEDMEEEGDPEKKFGENICLEDLSDEETSSETVEKKATRTRSKPKTSIQIKRNEKGETPLHVAAINNNLSLAQKLLDQGHSVDVRDFSGWTPLHEACNHGHKEMVELLIRHGAPVNDRGGPKCDGITPLLDAASNGNLDCIEALLENRASPLMKTNKGESALDCLVAWKMRRYEEIGTDLDPVSLAQYSTLYNRLQQIMEKAGQKVPSRDFQPPKKDPKKSHDSLGSLRKEIKNSKRFVDESAVNEYETAMQALRRQRHESEHLLSPMATAPATPSNALLTTEETVGDDWLDDDLGRPLKKRRTNEFLGGDPQRRSSGSGGGGGDYSSRIVEEREESREADVGSLRRNCVRDADPIELPSPYSSEDISCIPSSSGITSNKLKEMNAARKQPLSLLSEGMIKEKVIRTSLNDDSSSVAYEDRFSKVNYACVKVRVESKLLLVPISSAAKNVAWLAHEASIRYKSLEGVEPVLRLTTEDGASLVDSDPIELVLNMGDLVGHVLSWKIPSLPDFYKELCLQENLPFDDHLAGILEVSQASSRVSLADLCLDRKVLNVVLKAVSRHNLLLYLDLSGNFIGDFGIKDVVEVLRKFNQLKELDLSNINLSREGLSTLAQTIADNRCLQHLELLNIGYNPLGDCLSPLSTIINSIPHLRILRIAFVELRAESFAETFPPFALDTLQTLDINYNRIGPEGVIDLLGRLNPESLVELKMAGTSDATVREVGMFISHHTPYNLTTLDLSSCNASKNDVDELLSFTTKCPSLRILNLDAQFDSLSTPSTVGSHMLTVSCSTSLRELSLCGFQAQLEPQSRGALGNVTRSYGVTVSCGDDNATSPWSRKGPFGYITTSH